jgi:hypothetical protein
MPTIHFQPADDQKHRDLEKKIKKIDGLIGDYFLYADDRAFIASDGARFGAIEIALRREVTYIVKARIIETCKRKMNLIITLFGPPGTGKSYIGLTFACMIQFCYLKLKKMYPKKYGHLQSKIHLCFSDWEVNEALKVATPGDIVVQDERPVIHGQGSRITMDSINNIRKAVRAKQINYIGITPTEMHDVVVNMKFETLGYNEETGVNQMIVRGGRNNTVLGVAHFKKFILPELMEEYDKKKMDQIDDLLEAGGAVTSQQKEGEMLRKDSKIVLKYIRDNKIKLPDNPNKAKSELRPLIFSAGISSPSQHYIRDLVNYCAILLRMNALSFDDDEDEDESPQQPVRRPIRRPIDAPIEEEDEEIEAPKKKERPIITSNLEPEEEHESGFTFDMSKVFEKVRGKDKEIKVAQFQLAYNGKTDQEILEMYSGMSNDTNPISLRQIRTNVRSVKMVVNRELGFQWEDRCEEVYKAIDNVKKVTRGKHQGQSDFILEFDNGTFFVINAKAVSTDSVKYKYPPKYMEPELRDAERLKSEGKEVKMYIHFYSVKHKYEIMVPVNFEDPEPVVIEIPSKDVE